MYSSCCVLPMQLKLEFLSESFTDHFCMQLITDVNIAVAVEAIQAIGNLASGLRLHFSGSSRFLLPVLLVSTIRHYLQWE